MILNKPTSSWHTPPLDTIDVVVSRSHVHTTELTADDQQLAS